MSELFAARIGRVRMKNGGASLTVIEGTKGGTGDCAARLLECSHDMARHEGMESFFLVTIFENGNVGFSHRVGADCSVPVTILPAYVGELIRRNAIAKPDSEATFRELAQWVQ